MANKTEVLVHKGHDCSLWELERQTNEFGASVMNLRCLASGDRILVESVNLTNDVHWEDEELQLEHADKED